jgi:hypothetical protein
MKFQKPTEWDEEAPEHPSAMPGLYVPHKHWGSVRFSHKFGRMSRLVSVVDVLEGITLVSQSAFGIGVELEVEPRGT